ncbi:thioredoxin-dependent thiol peroxidase [Alicyclobacillus tolerans]|uniref:thioredoxin-dependent peroxiredoxin n=1 Tax=Alicyclobacillus tolerans TaxID=90970 RepID=A0ABT9LTC3_9BACL|nr:MULTISPECIES: thioredoxin-dependent thiol peroxidase [Alicyclobacillus]MDP9727502.1 peroxiredoxin Q/BCP [Alicyclobacillus tengchongensis]QRF23947.1 thioredoxin-dependent thiol peroxidase [Alicyclobacillus sp. TC]
MDVVDLKPGMDAPDFSLPNQYGETVHLSELKGQPVVLYFYPKDDTPGCTKEACAFRDLAGQFSAIGAKIYGISRDNVQSHEKFSEKYQLNFPILSDPDETVCNAYGVIREKNMYGKKTIGLERTTFVIDSEGKIAKVFRRVRVDGHADKVLEVVRSLAQE